MNIVPLILIGALIVVMLVMSNRNKAKRVTADAARRRSMVAGTSVMTTSGVFGTVTAVDPANDGSPADSVMLQIAPGVEVKWAMAAVREAPVRAVPDADGAPAGPAADVAATSAAGGATPVRRERTEPTVSVVKPKGRTAER